jgi:hypothetical protein
MADGGSRASGTLLACMLLSMTACVAIAGASDKSVDPCFDGCGDAGGSPSSNGDIVLEEGEPSTPPPQTSSSSGAVPTPETDGGTTPEPDVDGGSCPCPQGTQRDGDVCRTTASPSALQCNAPMQLPDCAVKLSLALCDTATPFFFEEACAKASGGASRPSLFLRFGNSPTGRWRAVIKGPFNVAKPNASCAQGGQPCIGGATEATTITIPNGIDGNTFAYGKRDGAGCDTVTVDLSFAQ